MQMTSSRTFMYGTFSLGASTPRRSSIPPPPSLERVPGTATIAIEILREFSASELVGKVYVKGRAGNWGPVSQDGVRDYEWYSEFGNGKNVEFRMDGSHPWKVLNFRVESDDSGPYVAVGLKLAE